MSLIGRHPVLTGILVALLLTFVAEIAHELVNNRRGTRGDFWVEAEALDTSDEALHAEMDLWDPEILATKPGTSEKRARDDRE